MNKANPLHYRKTSGLPVTGNVLACVSLIVMAFCSAGAGANEPTPHETPTTQALTIALLGFGDKEQGESDRLKKEDEPKTVIPKFDEDDNGKSIGEVLGIGKLFKKEENTPEEKQPEKANPTHIDSTHHVKDLIYGEILFDYFKDKNTETLIKILVANKSGTLSENKEHSDLLLGQLYIIHGLPKKAETVFERISKGKVSESTRNRANFQLVRLYTYQGNDKAAEKLLVTGFQNLATKQEVERRILLANLYAQRGDKEGVNKALLDLNPESIRGTYLKYNYASAKMLTKQQDSALPILKELTLKSSRNLESRTLTDKVNLTLGAYYVEQEEYGEAANYLSAVSYRGPYSNAALYYLGWSLLKTSGEKEAFPFWIDLSKRNPADPFVEQSYLARPYTFERLSSSYLALNGYLRATGIYKQLLKDLDKTIAIINSESWLDKFKPATIEEVGMYDQVPKVPGWIKTQNNEINFLYLLYSTDQFNEIYQNFWEIELIKRDLKASKSKFIAFSHQEKTIKEKYVRILPETERLLESEELEKTKAKYELIKKQVNRIEIEKDYFAAATPSQLDILHRLKKVEETLQSLPENEQLKQRRLYRALQGIVSWDMSQDANDRQWKIKHQFSELKALFDKTAAHEVVIGSASFDEKSYEGFTPRLNSVQTNIDSKLLALDLQSLKHQKLMRQLALKILDERKKELTKLIARAQLAAARLQDNVVSGGR